jgi:hypothetical protein
MQLTCSQPRVLRSIVEMESEVEQPNKVAIMREGITSDYRMEVTVRKSDLAVLFLQPQVTARPRSRPPPAARYYFSQLG